MSLGGSGSCGSANHAPPVRARPRLPRGCWAQPDSSTEWAPHPARVHPDAAAAVRPLSHFHSFIPITLPFLSHFDRRSDTMMVVAVITHIAMDVLGSGVEFNPATVAILARPS
jgi:hypothetical protein